MNDHEPEVLFEGIEVAIPMYQGMSSDKTEGCNEAIDSFSNGLSSRPEDAMVLGGRYRQILSSHRENRKTRQLSTDSSEINLISDTLKHLT